MNYRQIWKKHNGPIPKDHEGRAYEIHHIDGNRKNNSPENLIALSIYEHYDIHYWQEDWAACQSIVSRMKMSIEQRKKEQSELAQKRVTDGTHHFLDPEFIRIDSERKKIARKGEGNHMFGKKHKKKSKKKMSASQKKLVTKGLHHLQTEENVVRSRNRALNELELGTHCFQQEENRAAALKAHRKMLKKGTHPLQQGNRIDPNKIRVFCIHCRYETSISAFSRHKCR